MIAESEKEILLLNSDKNFNSLLERWYREGMDGDIPFMPAPGYKWSAIKILNMQIWENYQDVTLYQAIKKCEVIAKSI